MNQDEYAIAKMINGSEEYLRVERGDDCYTDDIGNALTYKTIEEVKLDLQDNEYFVKIPKEDDECAQEPIVTP